MIRTRRSRTADRPRRPRRRVSLFRLGLVTALVAVTGLGVFVSGARTMERLTLGDGDAWFGPYVDVTLPPVFHFEDEVESPATSPVLSFVVAAGDGSCTPTWGTHFTLDGASKTLDLDRRLTRLRERGGAPIVSFGGALNTELAVACTDVDELAEAYGAVVERYDLTTVDLDIEGPALTDAAANERRGEALAALQETARSAGDDLAVWLTLPVAPTGLTAEGVAVVDATVAAGVDLAGVNVMIMNYGGSRGPDQGMWAASEAALTATWRQLRGVYQRAGEPRTDDELWSMVGATPNLGQNDVATDRFTLDDAERLNAFATERGLGRISMWSANRDGPCGAQVDTNVYQPTCTGLDQDLLEFTYRFLAVADEDGPGEPTSSDGPAEKPSERAAVDPIDDPAASPYPVWRASKIYEAGDKVVWHRDVYEAKWWTNGDLPDEPVVNVWDSPWRYLGPVLEGETPLPPETPPGDVPAWDRDLVYTKGERVAHGGRVYVAAWWTTGEEPEPDPDVPWETPWELVEE